MPNDVIPQWDQLPDLTWKEKIAYLTHQFLTMEQTGCSVTHSFHGDLYVRDISIPAGSLFIGRAHRHGHVCQLLEGAVIHITEQGRRVVEAPFEMMTTPGYHVVLHALTDCKGRTVHPNPAGILDLDVLDAEYAEPVEALRALGEQIQQRMTCLT